MSEYVQTCQDVSCQDMSGHVQFLELYVLMCRHEADEDGWWERDDGSACVPITQWLLPGCRSAREHLLL